MSVAATYERAARRLPQYVARGIKAIRRQFPNSETPERLLPTYRPHAYDSHLAETAAELESPVPPVYPRGPVALEARPVPGRPNTYSDEPELAAARPRLVTGTPSVANARTSMDRLRELYETPIEDTNGRGKSGLYGALRGAAQGAQSGDLGYTLGAALGGLGVGLLRPRTDEEIARKQDIQRQQKLVKLEGEQAKEAAQLGLIKAQTANTEALPVYRSEEQRRKEEAERSKGLSGRQRVLTSIFNKADEFDVNDPANADMVEQMRAANLPVYSKKRDQEVKIITDPRTGEYRVVAVNKITGEGSASDVTNTETGKPLVTSTKDQMGAENQAARIASSEKIASILMGNRKEIATMQADIARARINMDASQFAARYPGAGKFITKEGIVNAAKEMKMLPKDALSEMLKQGYTIKD